MMINIITIYSDDLSLKKKMITIIRGGREGGGQRVMIEIIISENADNDGWPLIHVYLEPLCKICNIFYMCTFKFNANFS